MPGTLLPIQPLRCKDLNPFCTERSRMTTRLKPFWSSTTTLMVNRKTQCAHMWTTPTSFPCQQTWKALLTSCRLRLTGHRTTTPNFCTTTTGWMTISSTQHCLRPTASTGWRVSTPNSLNTYSKPTCTWQPISRAHGFSALWLRPWRVNRPMGWFAHRQELEKLRGSSPLIPPRNTPVQLIISNILFEPNGMIRFVTCLVFVILQNL